MAAKRKSSDRPGLTREQSLTARPVATTILRREPLPDGGQRVTIRFEPTPAQRWLLRVPREATKQFELDALGVEVLDLCDGEQTVRQIAAEFARRHRINAHEAERAVVTFLQTMVRKGLVLIAVPKG